MSKVYSILLFLLCFVASTQLLAKYWAPYLLLDDILLLFLTLLCLFDLMVYNRFSRINATASVLLGCFVILSFIANFYSLDAFMVKLFYYIKPIVVFTMIGYLANKYMSLRYKRYLYNFFILVCLFSLAEFYYVQFIDLNAMQYFSFSYRNGMYRASSVTWHPISLALLAFFSIIIGKEVIGDKRRWPYVLFLISLILSGTRFVMLFTAIYFLYRFLIQKSFVFRNHRFAAKHLFVYAYPFIFVLVLLLSSYVNIKDFSSLRSVSFRTGMPLLEDPGVLAVGTGIGSFGSYESVVNQSEVYDRINFPQHYKEIMLNANKQTGTENFFFMALIEFGVIGLFLYFTVLLRITSFKMTYFFSFYLLTVVCLSFVYPLNALPYLYLINIFFPFGKIITDKF